jgi:hypothetical protein
MSSSSSITNLSSRGNATRGKDSNGKATQNMEPVNPAPAAVVADAVPHATQSPFGNRQFTIAERAYLRAEQRGFEPGHEIEDWLAAEVETDQRIASEGRAY